MRIVRQVHRGYELSPSISIHRRVNEGSGFFPLWKSLIAFCFKIGVSMPGASPENVWKVSVFSNYVVKSITFCKIRMVAISSSYKNSRPYALAHNHEKWDILKICLQNHQLHFSKQRENVLCVLLFLWKKILIEHLLLARVFTRLWSKRNTYRYSPYFRRLLRSVDETEMQIKILP